MGRSFLYQCESLKSFDTLPLQNIPHIPDTFLSGCISLTALDFSSMSDVETVGYGFMKNCSSVTSLKLPSGNIKSVGRNFLLNCRSLTSLDLSPLSNLKHMSGCMFSGCSSLRSLDLSPMKNVKSVGKGFLVSLKDNKRFSILDPHGLCERGGSKAQLLEGGVFFAPNRESYEARVAELDSMSAEVGAYGL